MSLKIARSLRIKDDIDDKDVNNSYIIKCVEHIVKEIKHLFECKTFMGVHFL